MGYYTLQQVACAVYTVSSFLISSRVHATSMRVAFNIAGSRCSRVVGHIAPPEVKYTPMTPRWPRIYRSLYMVRRSAGGGLFLVSTTFVMMAIRYTPTCQLVTYYRIGMKLWKCPSAVHFRQSYKDVWSGWLKTTDRQNCRTLVRQFCHAFSCPLFSAPPWHGGRWK